MHPLLWLYYHKYLKRHQTFGLNKKRLTHTIYMLQSFDTDVFVKPQTSGFGTKIRTGIYEQSEHFSLSGAEFPCTDREQSASVLSYGEHGNKSFLSRIICFFFRFLLLVLLSLALNPIWFMRKAVNQQWLHQLWIGTTADFMFVVLVVNTE